MDFTDLAHTPLEELYQASGQAIVVAIPEVSGGAPSCTSSRGGR